jgi:stalled ribosome rescue protein Dom34
LRWIKAAAAGGGKLIGASEQPAEETEPVMSHYHACVWIDHQHAQILSIGVDSADVSRITDHGPVHHIHRKADHVHMGTEPIDHSFLKDVAEALLLARAILICGPGRARTELAGYLNEHFPEIARRVWGIEPMDHPTDGQLVAAARKYFHAADRMHA